MGVLKVTAIGNFFGIILPEEIPERLRVGKGDSLYVVETKNGIQLTVCDPAFGQHVEAAERVMREDRVALKKLRDRSFNVSSDRIALPAMQAMALLHRRGVTDHRGEENSS